MDSINNVAYAYQNLDEKMNANPAYANDLTRALGGLSQEQNKQFALLVAIADNKRSANGMRKLDVRDTTELAKIYVAQYPIVSSLHPNNPAEDYIYQNSHMDIRQQFEKDYTYFTLHGSNMQLGVLDRDVALAKEASDAKFSLANGEYEVANPVMDKKAKRDKKEANVADNLAAKAKNFLNNVFGKESFVSRDEIVNNENSYEEVL